MDEDNEKTTKQTEKLNKIHQLAMKEFDAIQSALRDERLQCLQDRRFYSIAGAQWEGPLGIQFENKPKFEVNKIHLAVIRIINEYRNNKVDALFISKDGEDNKLTDVCNGLYRSDEQNSGAEEAYDNAFEEAVGGGFGAWRLVCDYEDEEDEDNEQQRVKIEPIVDADSSVFFNLGSKRQDKADAKSCYVLTSYTKDAYKEEFGFDPASIGKVIHQYEFDWLTPDVVYVAEYYVIEKKKELIHIFRGLAGDEVKVSDEELKEDGKEEDLQATGYRELRQKKINVRKCHKYIMDGARILEDCNYIAGKNIPIIPVYGKRWFVDNVERCMGHVRLAKDTQRLMNMQRSKLGEISAQSTIEKPIMTPQQIAGHGQMWADDNIKNYPYLLINALEDQNGQPIATGPTAYTKVPNIPPAMAALLQITEQDMQDLMGNQQAGEELQSHISGAAVELVQSKLDMQTYVYISNFAKAKKRSGEVWLSMAKDIFIEEGRKLKTIAEDGTSKPIELMKPVMVDGKPSLENDLTQANFDVAVDVGPTSSSRRSATVKSLTGIMAITQDPQTLQVLNSMVMMNMEGEGINDVRDYFRGQLVKMGVVKPTDEEAKAMAQAQANQPPDPNAEFLKASAEQATAQAAKDRAQTMKIIKDATKVEADTLVALNGINVAHAEHELKVMQHVGNMQQSQAPQ
jgi:hypothetical protein